PVAFSYSRPSRVLKDRSSVILKSSNLLSTTVLAKELFLYGSAQSIGFLISPGSVKGYTSPIRVGKPFSSYTDKPGAAARAPESKLFPRLPLSTGTDCCSLLEAFRLTDRLSQLFIS